MARIFCSNENKAGKMETYKELFANLKMSWKCLKGRYSWYFEIPITVSMSVYIRSVLKYVEMNN